MRLQAVPTLDIMLPENPRNQHALAGNGMTVSVVGRVMARGFGCVGWAENASEIDVWACGEALLDLANDAAAGCDAVVTHEEPGIVSRAKAKAKSVPKAVATLLKC